MERKRVSTACPDRKPEQTAVQLDCPRNADLGRAVVVPVAPEALPVAAVIVRPPLITAITVIAVVVPRHYDAGDTPSLVTGAIGTGAGGSQCGHRQREHDHQMFHGTSPLPLPGAGFEPDFSGLETH